MISPERSPSLPCGTDLEELTIQVVERTPPTDPEHQAGCTYCRATLAELGALWSPMHDVVDEEVAAPGDLVARVMQEIQEVDYTGARAVIRAADGTTSIGGQVVAVIARKAADSVEGTLLTMTRATAGVEVGAVGRSVVLRLDLVVELGLHLPTLNRQIQRTVGEHVSALTGVTVVAVDVSVVDVAEGVAAGSAEEPPERGSGK